MCLVKYYVAAATNLVPKCHICDMGMSCTLYYKYNGTLKIHYMHNSYLQQKVNKTMS